MWLRGPITKDIGPDVETLLTDGYDDQSLVSCNDLEDDFVVIVTTPEFMIKNDKVEDVLETAAEDSGTSYMIYSSGSDGTLNCIDLEIRMPSKVIDLNPDRGNGPLTWRMLGFLSENRPVQTVR